MSGESIHRLPLLLTKLNIFPPLLRELDHKIVNRKNGTDLRKVWRWPSISVEFDHLKFGTTLWCYCARVHTLHSVGLETKCVSWVVQFAFRGNRTHLDQILLIVATSSLNLPLLLPMHRKISPRERSPYFYRNHLIQREQASAPFEQKVIIHATPWHLDALDNGNALLVTERCLL